MFGEIRLPPPAVRLLRDAMAMYSGSGILSFEAGKDALQYIRRGVAASSGHELQLRNTDVVRDAAIGVMRMVELCDNESFKDRVRKLGSVFTTLGGRVVDRDDAERIVGDVVQPARHWCNRFMFRRNKFKKMARDVYVPLSAMITEKTDLITLAAAGVFAVQFANDMDIFDEMAEYRGLRNDHRLIIGAMHTVFGMNRINKSLIAMDDKLFGGDEKRTARALLPRDPSILSALISINYRIDGLFLKSVHGEGVLRLLGAAEELQERATGNIAFEHASRMVAMLRDHGPFDDDAVAEYGRLALIDSGLARLAGRGHADFKGLAVDINRCSQELHNRLVERGGGGG